MIISASKQGDWVKILQFYIDGFRDMKVGKSLWIIIIIKFVIFFVIMKTLFFPNFMKENFSNDTERANYVLQTLTNKEK
ncbi:MAG: hypothetical protein KN64_11260 [Sulfurovum sp. AS07-7]|nr:MAG: hypothetical protein KN64_11260 [Sulfurovum sp. AS07-7]